MGVAVNYISNATATIAEADHYSNIRLFQVGFRYANIHVQQVEEEDANWWGEPALWLLGTV